MKPAILFTILATFFSSVLFAEDKISFEQYKISEKFNAPPANIDLTNNPKAKRFKTVLSEGAKTGPNFAGHYTIVTWGCGTACQEFAIVNAATGKVYFSPIVKLNAYQAVHDDTEPFQFTLESSLLVLAGSPDDNENPGFYFYHWNEKELVLLKYVPSNFEPK